MTLIDCVPAAGGARRTATTLYDAAVGPAGPDGADGARPLDEPLVEPPLRDDELPPVRRRTSPEQYAAAVEVAKEHILAGDIFQVVLSQRFDLDLERRPLRPVPVLCARSTRARTCTSCATPS